MSRPLPPITPETEAWWDATREQRLTVQRCQVCGTSQHYPRSLCTTCHADDLAMVEVTGRGRILSFSIVHRSADPAAFEVPYVVALVALDEGPVLTSNLVSADFTHLACDQPVTVQWEPLEDGRFLPQFTPTDVEKVVPWTSP